MTGSRGYRRTTNTPSGFRGEPGGRVQMFDKTFIGFVKENKDAIHMGRLQVWIPELSQDPRDQDNWYTVNYCSPFAGATRATQNEKDGTSLAGTQQSYGFWAVPPDLDNEVVVMFINGDPNRGIWVGCLYQQFMNHMVPGIASSIAYEPGESGVNPPVAEYNKWGPDASKDDPTRPQYVPLHKGLRNEGLYTDPIRGPSTASARRTDNYDPRSNEKNFLPDEDGEQKKVESTVPQTADELSSALATDTRTTSKTAADPAPVAAAAGGFSKLQEKRTSNITGTPPALVYGFKTPKGGHMYIDDAGDGLIRLRTSNGAQIVINDEVGYIYMISRNGNSWMEISDDGIDMYSAKSISMRAHGDLNFHADGNINQYSGGAINSVGQGGGTGSYHGGYNMLSDQLNLTSAGSVNIYSPVRVSISGPSVGIAASNELGITSGGDLGLTSSKKLSLVGKKIGQNSGKGPQAKVEPIQQKVNPDAGSGGSGSGSGGSSSSSSGSSNSTNNSGNSGPAGDTGAVSPPAASGGPRPEQAMRWFMSAKGGGFTKAQAAGIVGNLQQESYSGLKHDTTGYDGKHYGIAQWSSSRQDIFKKQYGKSIKQSTFEEQLSFVTYELRSNKSNGLANIKSSTTVAQATEAFLVGYERPGNAEANRPARLRYANALAGKTYDGEPPAGVDAPVSGEVEKPGPVTAPQPTEPTSGSDISGPIEANTPTPSDQNDRELNVEAQFPQCSTYTIVSRLPTHEPWDGHPSTPSEPVEGGNGGSIGVDTVGGSDVAGEVEDPNAKQPDDGKKFAAPMSGVITSLFGPRSLGGGRTRMHKGIDIAAPIGTPIIASKDGTVIKAGPGTGYGLVVYVSHPGGWTTRYGHVSRFAAKAGQKVKQGEVIAYCGNTGHSTGPHLHFEILSGGSQQNPANYLPGIRKGARATRGAQK